MSYQDIPYSTKSKIYNFLEQEFLNVDDKTFTLIAKHYYKHYGYGPYNYLLKTYTSWQRGWTSISSLTFGRIIECMPKYLSDDKRFFILQEEVHSFFDKKRNDFQKEIINLSELNQYFINFQNIILSFGKEDLQWFIGRGLFSEEQVEHYLKICRYVLNEKILQAYRQVANDLELIKTKLSGFNEPIKLASYNISFFDKPINVGNIRKSEFSFSPLQNLNFKIDESFKKFGEHYFLNELMKISFEDKKKQANTILKSNDIDMFFSHYYDLKKNTTNQVSMKSTFEGNGGNLSLHLKFVPYSVSKQLIYVASLRLLSYIGLTILLGVVISSLPKYWIILTIIGITVWFNTIFPKLKADINNIQEAKTNITKYGHQ
jgi:hypothetical protein